jgi:predicted MFS family arabinose efflux permease
VGAITGAAVGVVFPPRLGASFRWLVLSSWTSNLGDGLALAAGPLLVASLTDHAFLIALAALVQWLPPLLFALPAGVLSDRHDRRRIVMATDTVRVAVLGGLITVVVSGHTSIGIVLTALFALATAEVFADSGSANLTPVLVAPADLAIANSRTMGAFVTANQLIGPPIGAALFAAGWSVPFIAQAVLVGGGVALIARVVVPRREVGGTAAGDGSEPLARSVGREVREGVGYALRHPAVRTLVLTIFTFNITFGAAWSVLVLYAREQLGLGSVGFGLITTVQAAGGLAGTLAFGWISRRVSMGNIMRAGLIIETLTHLGLAVTSVPAVALAIFFVFGAHAFIWGTTSVTIRQRVVPVDLLGRVGAVNSVSSYGGLVLGSAVGGALAQAYGVTAPFWFAFAGSALFLVLIWRQLTNLSRARPNDRPSLAA